MNTKHVFPEAGRKMDSEKGISYLLRVVLNLAAGPGLWLHSRWLRNRGLRDPFPRHSLWERARKKDGGEKTSGTGDSLSVALRDESLISHRSISRSSGSCTHLMIGHDVSLNTRANEWLPTQTPSLPQEKSSRLSPTKSDHQQPTKNTKRVYAFLMVSFTEVFFCVAYAKAIQLKNSYLNVY